MVLLCDALQVLITSVCDDSQLIADWQLPERMQFEMEQAFNLFC